MKLKVDQTHEAYIITIPTSVVWGDAFLMTAVKMLQLYDPDDERAAYHRRLAELAGTVQPQFTIERPTESETGRA